MTKVEGLNKIDRGMIVFNEHHHTFVDESKRAAETAFIPKATGSW